MKQLALAWDALWFIALFWLSVITFAVWREALWPTVWSLQQVVLVWCLAVTYFFLKALLIGRRAIYWDVLTVTVIAVNTTLGGVFLLQVAGMLWPAWALRNYTWINPTALWTMTVILIAGIIELALVPNTQEEKGIPMYLGAGLLALVLVILLILILL
jgi:hypothetical protein